MRYIAVAKATGLASITTTLLGWPNETQIFRLLLCVIGVAILLSKLMP